MDFYIFKADIVNATGLDKDALHIYVGMSVYLLSLILLRPIFGKYSIRSFIALIMVTCIALLGEYLDNRHTITELGISGLGSVAIKASIHDLLNTCLLPSVLYALTRWTRTFHSVSQPSSLLKQR